MKRFLISILMVLPGLAFSQNCELKQEKDLITDAPKLSTGFFELNSGNKKLLISIEAGAKEIDYFFVLNTGKETCFDNNSTVNIIFEGGRLKSNYRNTGTMNCEGMFHITFKNAVSTPSALKRLFDKKIITIGFTASDKKETIINLTEQEQQKLMQLTACLVEQAKSLVK